MTWVYQAVSVLAAVTNTTQISAASHSKALFLNSLFVSIMGLLRTLEHVIFIVGRRLTKDLVNIRNAANFCVSGTGTVGGNENSMVYAASTWKEHITLLTFHWSAQVTWAPLMSRMLGSTVLHVPRKGVIWMCLVKSTTGSHNAYSPINLSKGSL